MGNFDKETASSTRRNSEVNVHSPRRRSASNLHSQPLPERFRAPVRSSLDGDQATQHVNESVRRHPLFQSANKLFVDQIISGMTVELFQPGARILTQGDEAYLLYFLHRGDVEVSVHGNVVATLRDGAFFGEMALLDKTSKRNATVKAVSFCDCRVIHRKNFNRLLKLFPAERAFFEAEADRRNAQLQTVKKAETTLRSEQASGANKERGSKGSGKGRSSLDKKGSSQGMEVKELPPPYIAEAFLVTAMLNRAYPTEVGRDDESNPLAGLSTLC